MFPEDALIQQVSETLSPALFFLFTAPLERACKSCSLVRDSSAPWCPKFGPDDLQLLDMIAALPEHATRSASCKVVAVHSWSHVGGRLGMVVVLFSTVWQSVSPC